MKILKKLNMKTENKSKSKSNILFFKDIAINFLKISNAKLLVLGFLVLILIGAFLLQLDISLVENKNITFIDSIFVATSATCVTGLSTVPINDTFNVFGKCVLLFLIQIGAIGFMTFVCLVFQMLGKKLSLRNRVLFEESFDIVTDDIKKLVKRIVIFSFITEIVGAILLTFSFIPKFGKIGIFYSIFHSVSAFCNAGFDLFGNTSLIKLQSDWYVNVVIMTLIILGGIGYLVIFDILKKIKYTVIEKRKFKHLFSRFNLHTKIVLITTLSLIIVGFLLFFILEFYNINTLYNKDLGDKILISLFQSVSARTAGFNTIDMSMCTKSTNLMYMVLMFIGGSPTSTAGGIKTVSFAILILTVVSMLRKKRKISIYNKQIPEENVRKAIVIFFLSITIIFFALLLFMTFEDCDLLEGMFEIVSAFGTVGSSLGITSDLTYFGKILLMVLMFIGRLGSVTVIMSMIHDNNIQSETYEFPKERIILG